MKKIENWNEIEAKGMDDFKALPIGAYECKIINAVENHNEESGKTTLKVMVDIASGEYKDYFKKRYDSNTAIDRKWDNNATKYLAFEGENTSFFKGFITTVENSNVGYKWNWDETTLRDKKIVGVFQYEQYKKQDGTKALKVRLTKFRSLDKLKEIEVSDSIKMLDGTYTSYNDYMEKVEEKKPFSDFGNIVEFTDELPF
ncbi:MAG: DUF669 domain-containing protein [Bacilli bacterium]|nr:DUF669 domain-containing protein [Bacilli bacterium]MDY5832850.1 DUF669 domain-containing protein [Candidatus Onthovivens sp.]